MKKLSKIEKKRFCIFENPALIESFGDYIKNIMMSDTTQQYLLLNFLSHFFKRNKNLKNRAPITYIHIH